MIKLLLTCLIPMALLSPSIAHSKTNNCPSQYFPTFLKSFQSNLKIQKAFTVIPLKSSSFYPNYGNQPDVSYLKASEIKFPLLISYQERKAQGVKLSIKKQSARAYKVFTRSQGSGAYSFDYNFKYSHGCWRLIELTDLSS